MDITAISDLHGYTPQLDGGDLLIIAGDLTARDDFVGYCEFNEWLVKNMDIYHEAVIVSGNHDNNMFLGSFDPDVARRVHYLCDNGVTIGGFKVWGSPWTKTFPGMNPKCKAFTLDREEKLADKWKLIPDDTDILVTHGPMWGTHDLVVMYMDDYTDQKAEHLGSGSLAEWISNHINSLKLHVCGHIHEGYGLHDIRQNRAMKGQPETCVMVNASYVDAKYRPVNKPIRVIL